MSHLLGSGITTPCLDMMKVYRPMKRSHPHQMWIVNQLDDYLILYPSSPFPRGPSPVRNLHSFEASTSCELLHWCQDDWVVKRLLILHPSFSISMQFMRWVLKSWNKQLVSLNNELLPCKAESSRYFQRLSFLVGDSHESYRCQKWQHKSWVFKGYSLRASAKRPFYYVEWKIRA